jgi:hypothetical protein
MFVAQRRLFSVVAPPFLYGIRNPLVAGIIRQNDEISTESKKMLNKHFFARIGGDATPIVEAVEVVSDDSMHRSHDPTHIEAGVGVIVKTIAHLPRTREAVPCAIVMNCMHVGVRNDFKNYHANQARVMCEHYAESWVQDEGRGLVVSVGSDVTSEGYMHITDSRTCKLQPVEDQENLTLEPVSSDEKSEIFSTHFTLTEPSTSVETVGLVDIESDTLICGASLHGKKMLTDPFITTDCPAGKEVEIMGILARKLGRVELEFCGNDRFIDSLFPVTSDSVSLSVLPMGLSVEDQENLLRYPWVTGGIFNHLRHQLIS